METTVAFFQSHLDFLTTDHAQSNPPFKRRRSRYSIHGINLPPEACAKILEGNTSRLLGVRSA